MTKNKSRLRIILSTLAMISFIVYSVYDHIVISEFESYFSYSWRMNILEDLFVFMPFLALFTAAIFERKLKHLDSQVYIGIIFAVLLLQHLFLFFIDEMNFSLFCDNTFMFAEGAYEFLFWARIILLFGIIFFNDIPLKIYSIFMIGCSSLVMFVALTSSLQYSMVNTCLEAGIDILFHIALFFFADLLRDDNDPSSKDGLMNRIINWVANIIDALFIEDDEADELETGDEIVNELTPQEEQKMIERSESLYRFFSIAYNVGIYPRNEIIELQGLYSTLKEKISDNENILKCSKLLEHLASPVQYILALEGVLSNDAEIIQQDKRLFYLNLAQAYSELGEMEKSDEYRNKAFDLIESTGCEEQFATLILDEDYD